MAGGTATRITSGLPFDSQPRYSPDGARIVFLSDRSGDENVWTAKADGTDPKPLTTGKNTTYRSPEWSPDPNYIVVSKQAGPGGMQLWLYHVDGGSGVKATGHNEEQKNMVGLGAAFGRDPRFIYFSERTDNESVYNQMTFRWQLSVFDRHTGEVFRKSDAGGSAMRPVVSPDGKWLVYATRWDAATGLRLRNLQSGDDAWLVHPVQRDDQESASTRDLMPGSSFTPDSGALVTSFDGRIWRVEVPSGRISPIPFTARVDQQLGPKVHFEYTVDQGPLRAQQIRFPRLSPDGTQLAFTALDRLYLMDYPKGAPRRVSKMDVGEHQPTWSADGRHLAYVTWSDAEGGHVYRVPAAGGQPERLTQVSAYYSTPVYSPDGQRIVVVRGPREERQEDFSPTGAGGQSLELLWLPAGGGPTTLIAPYHGPGRPHFAAARDRIYAWEEDRGLVSFRFDGTDRKTHVKVTGWKPPNAPKPVAADDVIMGPDGEHALAEAQHHVYLITVPMVGGEPPSIAVHEGEDAAVPVKKLTTVGGEFLDWAAGGKAVTFALGHTLFRFDLPQARVAWDKERAEAQKKAAEDDKKRDDTKDEAGKEDEKDKEEEKKKPAYQAVETDVIVEVPRAKPTGTIALRGARIISMKGAEVIENGDIVVTANRIVAIGARGTVKIPSGARTFDVTGKTIMPGIVDVHAHMWPAWGIHKTQIWEYLANLAYGVTTTRDPQTATTDMLSYRDMVEAGAMLGPRVFGTGPGVFSAENIQSLDDARDVLKRYSKFWDTKTIKQYMVGNRQKRQWVIMAAKEQQLTPTLEGGLDMKLNLTQVHRRVRRGRAHAADHAALQGCGAARGGVRHHVYADAAGAVRGTMGGELLLREHGRARRRQTAALHPARRPGQRGAAAPVVPPAGILLSARGESRRGHRRRRRECRLGWTRPAAGDPMPLGDVGARVRRPEGARRASHRDDLGRAGDRLREGSRIARRRQARGPDRAGPQPAREPPEHEHGTVRDEERRDVPGGHARSDVAGAEEAAAAGTGGIWSRHAGRPRPWRRRCADGPVRLDQQLIKAFGRWCPPS